MGGNCECGVCHKEVEEARQGRRCKRVGVGVESASWRLDL